MEPGPYTTAPGSFPDIKRRPSAATTGIDLTRFSAEDLEEVPILAELKKMTTSNA